MAGFTAYTRAARWLTAQLTQPAISGVLDVYEWAAPEGETSAEDVWIEFEAMDPGSDVAEVAAQRIWTEFAFLVRAMTRGRSTQELEPTLDEIDNRLHRKDGTVIGEGFRAGGRIISCTRQENVSEAPESWLRQGVEYRGLGSVWNVIVQPL